MRKTLFFAAIAALSAGFTPPSYNDTYTTNGVTYAQLGGVKGSNYVVTAVSIQGGTYDYADLTNKPSVNGVSLSGDNTAADLGLQDAIADYTTTGAVRSLVEGYGFATAGSVAAVARSATNYVDVVVGGLDIPSGQDITNAATWAAGSAYDDAVAAANAYTDASISETNDAFVAAVHAASPPVVLPQKWALANVTNASGGAVGAADVGAAKAGEVVKLTGDQSIGGSKTFETAAYFNGGLAAPSTIAVYGQDSSVRFEVDNIMTGDYVRFGVGDFLDIGFDYTKRGNSYRVDLPERSGVLSVEGWASTYRALNEATANAVTCAQLCGAIEKATESKPHFAIIDGEVHIITITD